MPKNLSETVGKSFDHADNAVPLLDEVFRAEASVKDNAVAYRPIHRKVRRIENNARKLNEEIDKLVVVNKRLDPDEDVAQKSELDARISVLKEEQQELISQIPADWVQVHKEFSVLTKAELRRKKNIVGC
ncbi:MAG: hypothetical protein CM1200mP18_05920 [Gammaproteobacteria bacterium]|nr:MAG: hypothetical protein CM1200mP18_05920 [Gammaproteobacteria bacterium]